MLFYRIRKIASYYGYLGWGAGDRWTPSFQGTSDRVSTLSNEQNLVAASPLCSGRRE